MKTTFNDLAENLINNVFADIARGVTIQPSRSVYDEESGEVIDFEPETFTVKGIVGPFSETKSEVFDLQVGDVRAILPIKSLTPEYVDLFLNSDVIFIDGVSHKLLNSVIDASDSVYTLQLRKG